MKLLFNTLIIALIGFGCNGSKQVADTSPSETQKSDFYLRIERTACFGACPTDVLIIDNTQLSYQGIRHVDRLGSYTSELTPAQLTVLRDRFDELNFFDFQDKYDAGVSDLPSTIFKATVNDSTKSVINRYMGPQELKSFEIWVFSYVDKLSWSPVEDQDQ
jgi:hypothetical protein